MASTPQRVQAEEVPAPLSGMARYEKGPEIGEGTYGVVFKAQDRLARRSRSRSRLPRPWRRRARPPAPNAPTAPSR